MLYNYFQMIFGDGAHRKRLWLMAPTLVVLSIGVGAFILPKTTMKGVRT